MGAPVLSIPAGVSFVDALAAGLLARAGGDRLALARMQIYLPTRRACRALADAFLRQTEGAALLAPAMTPIGDADDADSVLSAEDELAGGAAAESPPAIPDLRRRLLLTRLIMAQRARGQDGRITADQAARLAEELARFLDQVQTERLGFDRLADLAPEDYAEHWKITLAFLRIVTEHWPAILAETGCVDPAERRNRLIADRIAAWRAKKPRDPIVVAGSTGSVPATADLIAAVAALPEGIVVLPGLDRTIGDDAIRAMRPTHPQFTMVSLLGRMGLAPGDVAEWPNASPPAHAAARSRLVAAAMSPAGLDPEPVDPLDARAASGSVRRVDCASEREEAAVVALALREALETPGKTAALVTPDRGLARRVAAQLRRWDIAIDDSAGIPLGETAPGNFLRLTAAMVAERAGPADLLACLKHPLAAGGLSPESFRARVRRMEVAVLRGPRPEPGLAGVVRALDAANADPALIVWAGELAEQAAELERCLASRTPLDRTAHAHVALAERLAGSEAETGADRLWRGEAGEEAARFVRDLLDGSAAFGPIEGGAYPALLDSLMQGRVVRPRYGRHPRLHIWGPLEARLQQTDLLILGGLNEGTWPPDPAADPWMSRPMRHRFGLPAPERRVGLSAHDFAQAFSAPEVMLTRATRVGGSPTVPCRWLLQLDNVLEAAGCDGALRADEGRWLAWQGLLDRPALPRPIHAPAPCPPVAVRPRRLSVTRIETLIRDPYAIYARYILNLRPLEPIDADPAAAERGTAIHEALDAFLRSHPGDLPQDALEMLLAAGREQFGPMLDRPGVRAFWWPRFVRIAEWFVDHERARRAGLRALHSEVMGGITFDAPAGPFELTAKADRIEERADGAFEIVDYKTGRAPQKQDVANGWSPQLPLEAMILADGGFEAISPAAPSRLAIWRLSGGDPPGQEMEMFSGDARDLLDRVRSGVRSLIELYDDPGTGYRPRPNANRAPARSDYDHLARVKEWSAAEGGNGA